MARMITADGNGHTTCWVHVKERKGNVVHIVRERTGGVLNRQAICETKVRGSWRAVETLPDGREMCRVCQLLWGRGEAA